MRKPIFEDTRNREYWDTLIKDIDLDISSISDIREFNDFYFSRKGIRHPHKGLYACDYARKSALFYNKENTSDCAYCPYEFPLTSVCSSYPVGLLCAMQELLKLSNPDSSLFYAVCLSNNEGAIKLAKTCENNLRGLTIKIIETIRDWPIRKEVKCRSKTSILRFWE